MRNYLIINKKRKSVVPPGGLTGIFPWYQIVSPNALSIDSGEPEEEELQIQYTPQLSPERFDFGVQGFC